MFRLSTLFFLSFFTAIGQDQTWTPNSLWIDKPITKSDSIAIIKSGYKKITVYERHATDGQNGQLAYDTTLIGAWTISVDGSKMSCTWTGKFSNWDHVTSQKVKQNKIIQTIGKDKHKFQLTHDVDKNGVITHTKNKIMSPFETRYHFDDINYSYADGLLIEASYFSSDYDPKTTAYTRYVFEYTK